MINTIVVPTDGSEHANKAIEMAGEIAVPHSAQVGYVSDDLQDRTAPARAQIGMNPLTVRLRSTAHYA